MEFVEPIRDKKKIEAMKLLLRGSNLRDYCLFVLGINSGLRVSDLLRLNIEDVLSERGKVLDRITIREKKTGKAKTFPISNNSRKAIEEYLEKRASYLRSEPLFASRKGNTHIQRVQAWKALNKAAKAVGIKERMGTHTLRKTFAYHAFKQGQDITLLQKLLNHSAPSITLRYIGITQDQLDDVYLTLNL
ncbi:site-specific integrase [Alicyclobacillus fodiniaquatilis]|uniref:Site-specific integrase n=1 Tax=Alicyclobacillus fodiniaquatilis TaxID=1661150 RepID=A0ABW4JEL6_9BACL